MLDKISAFKVSLQANLSLMFAVRLNGKTTRLPRTCIRFSMSLRFCKQSEGFLIYRTENSSVLYIRKERNVIFKLNLECNFKIPLIGSRRDRYLIKYELTLFSSLNLFCSQISNGVKTTSLEMPIKTGNENIFFTTHLHKKSFSY